MSEPYYLVFGRHRRGAKPELVFAYCNTATIAREEISSGEAKRFAPHLTQFWVEPDVFIGGKTWRKDLKGTK